MSKKRVGAVKVLIIALVIMAALGVGIIAGLRIFSPIKSDFSATNGVVVKQPSKIANPAVCPVLNRFSRVIGGMVGDRWVGSEEMARHLKGGEKYKLYDLCRYIGEYEGLIPKTVSDDPDRLTAVELKHEQNDNKYYGATFSIACNWNPIPRSAEVKEVNQSGEDRFITGLLVKNGMPKETPVIIQKRITVDLDGDGKREILIIATNVTQEDLDAFQDLDDAELTELKKDKYCITLLRQSRRGVVDNQVIQEDYKKIAVHDLELVADLDHDGVLELMINNECIDAVLAEGFSVGTRYLYKLKGGKLVEMGEYFNSPQ